MDSLYTDLTLTPGRPFSFLVGVETQVEDPSKLEFKVYERTTGSVVIEESELTVVPNYIGVFIESENTCLLDSSVCWDRYMYGLTYDGEALLTGTLICI